MNRFIFSIAFLPPLLYFSPANAKESAADDSSVADAIELVVAQPGQAKYAAVLDYRKHSGVPRFHVVDTQTKQLVQSFIVAHGEGSDTDNNGYAEKFSDVNGSLASSLGLYQTGDRFRSPTPNHGLSVRLIGKSNTNKSAYARKVVIHANTYVEKAWLKKYGRPGRSHGCMTFSAADRDAVVKYLGTGAWIYAFADK